MPNADHGHGCDETAQLVSKHTRKTVAAEGTAGRRVTLCLFCIIERSEGERRGISATEVRSNGGEEHERSIKSAIYKWQLALIRQRNYSRSVSTNYDVSSC